MLFSKKRPRGSRYFEQDDEEEDKEREERHERIKFRSLRTHRKTGARSLLWLIALFVLVAAIFFYISH